MNKIIHLSDRLNRKGEEIVISNMEDIKNEINNINDEIDEIRESLEIYPNKINNKRVGPKKKYGNRYTHIET